MYLVRFLCAFCLMFCIYGFADKKMVYDSCTAGVSTKTDWTIITGGDKVFLDGKNPRSDIKIECSPNYSLLRYFEKSDPSSKELDIRKEGPYLMIKSKEKGKEKTKSFKIGDTPWVQEFKFGFREFLQGNQKEYTFYIVNPKDLDVHEMIATKESIEKLEVRGVMYNAQKVKVTLKGFKKRFWKAYVWFDKELVHMIRYLANEGPGTSYTETDLVSIEG